MSYCPWNQPLAYAVTWSFVDVDDTVVEIFSPIREGGGIGHNKVRGLNALLTTVSTARKAPLVLSQQSRKGTAHLIRGAHKFVSGSLSTAKRMIGPTTRTVTRLTLRCIVPTLPRRCLRLEPTTRSPCR